MYIFTYIQIFILIYVYMCVCICRYNLHFCLNAIFAGIHQPLEERLCLKASVPLLPVLPDIHINKYIFACEYIYGNKHVHVCMYICMYIAYIHIALFYRAVLQKRPIIVKGLLIVATPHLWLFEL